MLISVAAALLLPANASAAFPGENGLLAWSSNRGGNHEIYSANGDGTGVARLTNDSAQEIQPAWSPDGSEIAFVSGRSGANHVWVMNADGTNPLQVTTHPSWGAVSPSWSPDGSRLSYVDAAGGAIYTVGRDGNGLQLVYSKPGCPPDHDDLRCFRLDHPHWSPAGDRIAFDQVTRIENVEGEIIDEFVEVLTVMPDGSDVRVLTRGIQPAWSPDAGRIAFSDSGPGGLDIYTMTSAGANRTPAVSLSGGDNQVAWSPDGTRLVFVTNTDGDGEIITARPDGTDLTQLTFNNVIDRYPDWQPAVNSYVRPKGATPQRFSLVTAYEPCTAPDRVHGPPLAYPSCSGPRMTSDEITVGTGDSNGLPAKFRGHLNIQAIPGTPQSSSNDADVRVEFVLLELFDRETLEPYAGEVQARFNVQITDKENMPHPGGQGAGTTVEIPFEMTAQTCVPGTPGSPPQGTSCVMVSELTALLPGAVKEGGRAIWQVDDVEIWDGGPDGDAETEPNTLFGRPGVFIP